MTSSTNELTVGTSIFNFFFFYLENAFRNEIRDRYTQTKTYTEEHGTVY